MRRIHTLGSKYSNVNLSILDFVAKGNASTVEGSNDRDEVHSPVTQSVMDTFLWISV